jgi:hypothetical protein
MLFCRECFVKQHVDNPLHVVEVRFDIQATLRKLTTAF